MNLPNLFIVGFGRSGTTSLHNYLAQHPSIFMSSAKEPNHFCTDVVFGASRRARFTDRAQYLALFDDAAGETIRGESSTMYILSDAARSAIASIAPDARIVISIRNPTDFLVSWHAHGVGIGYETAPDLGDALDLESERRGREPHHLGSSLATAYRETINAMPELVQGFLDTFGRDQVHIVTFDELTTHQAESFAGICRFLGVDDTFEPDFAARNYDPSNLHVLSMFRHVPEPIRTRLGPLAKPLVKRIAPMLKKTRTDRPQVATASGALIAELAAEFAPVVKDLERVTGKDLSAWIRT
ncbi:MAG: sulfotransferase [Actinomycetia bacterium]|nr:sulfotransferase [Actinomycetes bacterium]MCP4960218.1 sulfotransferase [Actinomycetes bacterium]